MSPADILKEEKQEYDKLQDALNKSRREQQLRRDHRNIPEDRTIDMHPVETESKNPTHYETKPGDAVEKARRFAASGAQFPNAPSPFRPTPQQPVKEEGSVIVAKALAEQLGTSPDIKGQMRIDERKLAVLTDATLVALSHFSFRYTYDEVRYYGHITEWFLTGSQGIGGRGRRDILQAISNSSGVQSVEKAEKPNVVARNLWDRSWRKKAESEGKVVDE